MYTLTLAIVFLVSVLNITCAIEDAQVKYKPVYCGEEITSERTDCYFQNKTDVGMSDISDESHSVLRHNIFFIETSCNGAFNFREACSVESAARSNPHRQVNVLFLGPVSQECLDMWPLKNLLEYVNVRFFKINIKEYLQDTPLSEFVNNKTFKWTIVPVHFIANILKYATLYKYGGIYLDLNIIVAKPFKELPLSKNFVGRESDEQLSYSVIGLSKNGIGPVIAAEILNNMATLATDFNPYFFEKNFDNALTEVLEAICGTRELQLMSAFRCRGFQVYSPKYFYPIAFRDYQKYFIKFNETIPNQPYTFSIWTYMTPARNDIRNDFLARTLVSKYCPSVYKGFLQK